MVGTAPEGMWVKIASWGCRLKNLMRWLFCGKVNFFLSYTSSGLDWNSRHVKNAPFESEAPRQRYLRPKLFQKDILLF
jgi:hypothetical protein